MEQENSLIPSAQMAQQVVAKTLGCGCHSVERFPTGLCHFVYGVRTTNERNLVVRIAEPKTRHALQGGIYWSKELRPCGVPLPELIAYDANARNPFMIIDWLPGEDLGECYQRLSAGEKKELAARIVDVQRLVHTFPKPPGFGFAFSYNDSRLEENPTWLNVLYERLEGAHSSIRKVGVCDELHADRVAAAVEAHRPYFEQVQPVPFLDDTTTKNVLIHDGKLSGIVDVDEVCFGDPLLTLALTRMSLLQGRHKLDYIDHWKSLINPDSNQELALDIYTAIYCVIFMGEIGQQFNKDSPSPVDPERVKLYEKVLDDLLAW